MIRIRWLLIAVFCLFLFPSISYAECDYQRASELNKIASNVQFSYSYDVGDNNIPNIYLNISNITSDIYVEHFGDIYNSDVEHLSFEGFKTTKFNIYSNDPNCAGTFLMTKYMSLPRFNVYHNYEACLEYPDVDYCQMWFDSANYYYSDVLEQVDKYKNSLSTSDENIQNSKDTFIDFIISIRYYLFIGLFVLLFIILIIFIRKKRRKEVYKL